MVQILVYQLSCVTVFIRSDLFLSVTKIISYRTTTSESRESFDILVFRIIEHGVNDLSFSQAEKKSSLVSGNRPGKKFLSLIRQHSRMCIKVYIFKFKKHQTNKKQESKKAKETKEEKRISPENRLKKYICGRPGEDFSRHQHFRKQEYYFFSPHSKTLK